MADSISHGESPQARFIDYEEGYAGGRPTGACSGCEEQASLVRAGWTRRPAGTNHYPIYEESSLTFIRAGRAAGFSMRKISLRSMRRQEPPWFLDKARNIPIRSAMFMETK
jgi:hypothetical protein